MKVCPKCGKQYGDDANFCTNDAGRLVAMAATAPAAVAPVQVAAAPSDSLIGGRFELGERVGGGLTGDLHRAADRQAGGTVALKLIDPAMTSSPANAQRIERELKLLERVTSPAAARVIASGKHGERLWVATEWVADATPLGAALTGGPLAVERAAEIVAAIGGALLDAAKVGVVHRDLSPKNVLLTSDGVKVINFPLPMPGDKVPGVPGYVPPEALEGKPIDQRSATYSLGSIYYAALTGGSPWTGDVAAIQAQQLTGAPPPPSTKVPLPPEVDQVIARAMDRNPAKRHLTLKQFLDDVDRVAKGGDLPPSSTAPFGRVGKTREGAATMLGVTPITAGNEQKTRQMDVQIPPEALREAAALEALVPIAPPTLPPEAAPAPPSVFAPPPAYVPPPVAPAPVAAVAPSSSPWAAPPAEAPGPMTPAVHAVAAAAPALGAVAAAAPAAPPAPVAAPSPSQAPTVSLPAAAPTAPAVPAGASMSGKDKAGKRKEGGKKKGQFRETMWFKKGDLDAAAAEEAARSGDGAAQDKADSLPMEDRYKDDGTISSSDADRYSLRTGQTSSMPVMRDAPSAASSVSERDLIGELKGGRKKIFFIIGAAVVVVGAIIAAFAL